MAMARRISGQLSFSGLDAMPTDRLFFAVLPDAPAARRASEIAERLRGQGGLKGRALGLRRFHVSLHFLGDYVGLPGGMVAKARDAASEVAEAPFGVAFD